MDAFIVRYPKRLIKTDIHLKENDNTQTFFIIHRQGQLPTIFIYQILNIIDDDINEWRCLPIQTSSHNSCLNYTQLISDKHQTNFINKLLEILTTIVDKRLTKNQKLVISKIKTLEEKQTMTSLSSTLSQELNISKTTARNCLQILRDIGLITCGSATNKGKHVHITPIGLLIFEEIEKKKKGDEKK